MSLEDDTHDFCNRELQIVLVFVFFLDQVKILVIKSIVLIFDSLVLSEVVVFLDSRI